MLSDGLHPPRWGVLGYCDCGRRVQWAIVRLVQQELEDRSGEDEE